MENVINVLEVRKQQPRKWTFSETTHGWTARFGDDTLICVNANKVRYFSDLDRALRRLSIEVGVSKFEVELERPLERA